MNYFERRKYRKLVEALLHDAKHARGMREDVAAPADLDRMVAIEQKLRDAWKTRDAQTIDTCAEELGHAREKIWPPRKHPSWRENIEMFIVVLAVATGIRTYFISPFKIPTGSMQPTLNGITAVAQPERHVLDYFPLNVINFVLFGSHYVEVRALESGTINYVQGGDEYFTFANQGRTIEIPKAFFDEANREACVFFRYMGDVVEKGQLLACGCVRTGDMIFVDRVRYNLMPPKRGDIIVFRTKNIHHPGVRPNDHYIKRLVGLPNDTIQVDPPYLVVNGKKVEQPLAFHRMLTDPRYFGYTLPGGSQLTTPEDQIKVGQNEFLPFGDNSRSSLDGRYFGPVSRNDLLGPAFMVFWPFTSRWGLVH